jgi:hypothetical protein
LTQAVLDAAALDSCSDPISPFFLNAAVSGLGTYTLTLQGSPVQSQHDPPIQFTASRMKKGPRQFSWGLFFVAN